MNSIPVSPIGAIDKFEVHSNDLRTGRGVFDKVAVTDRIALRDAWMNIGKNHGVCLALRTVDKKRYAKWLNETFGAGILINPHVTAFAMLAKCVDTYLKSLSGSPLGMLIFDENKQMGADVEKSLKILRSELGNLRLTQIIEKGFFIDSHKSLPLQLCDLFAMSARKRLERRICPESAKRFDDSGIAILESLIGGGVEGDLEVIEWIRRQNNQKK